MTGKSSAARAASPLPDPGHAQRAASDPAVSAWVAASAGSGKTKVLTDRVLRLLLPRADGEPGTPPQKILCLTYTKAAASEMTLRLSQILSQWATIGDNSDNKGRKLAEILEDLLARPATLEDLDAARRLFAQVTDTPGGLKIMTIHAACQSILARFPLEAGLPPQFTVLTEEAAALLLQQARDHVLRQAAQDGSTPLGSALGNVAALLNDSQFAGLLESLCAERHALGRLFTLQGGLDNIYAGLCRLLGAEPGADENSLLQQFCTGLMARHGDDLRAAAAALCAGDGVKDTRRGAMLAEWLALPPAQQISQYNLLTGVFLKKSADAEGPLLKSLMNAKTKAAYPAEHETLLRTGNSLAELLEKQQAQGNANLTRDVLLLGDEILRHYTALKHRRAALDFDDLILRTRGLLSEPAMTPWVLYKLDGGLDHILIDEAQDTNPEQWEIIEALVGEFFTGAGARDVLRTLFTVGDEKQSIFSFQRAAPDRFHEKRTLFQAQAEEAGREFRTVPLDVSFRSAHSVLHYTDAVFAAEGARAGVSAVSIHHTAFRQGQAGTVELWPLFKTESADDADPWEPPVAVRERAQAPVLLARHIAQEIDRWLREETLPSRGRRLQPGDIMILVRQRGPLVAHMIRALKARGLPVSGIDRLVLARDLAVKDLIAAANFALLPGDDLTLATVLRSPFIALDDRTLEDLAWDRGGRTLWERVRVQAPAAVTAWLEEMRESARTHNPYEFFRGLLQHPCPADPRGGHHALSARLGAEIADPLNEFLNLVLDYEATRNPLLQEFVHAFAQGDTEIKREQEEAGGRIRIMTVHASKGLQAPVVILPDTLLNPGAARPRDGGRLLWPAKTGLPLPLWAPRRESESKIYGAAREQVQNREREEYRRLFYVALTRAEDRLYIGGAQGAKKPDPQSWYFLAQQAFEHCDRPQARAFAPDFPGAQALQFDGNEEQKTRFIENAQEAGPDRAHKDKPAGEAEAADFDPATLPWIGRDAPQESAAHRTFVTPGTIADSADAGAAASPLSPQDPHRFRRGLLTHRLLQFLPDIAPARRAEAARAFVAQCGRDLPETVRASVAAEVLAITESPAHAALFGADSRAEVPITGLAGDALISGQVDRLVVTDDYVHIVDYKTNRPAPKSAAEVPPAYRRQLSAYARVLRAIYPDRAMRTSLLWTDGARLMDVELKEGE